MPPESPEIYILIIGFVYGLILGSFSSAIFWRVPRKLPWVYELDAEGKVWKPVRSQCPSCRQQLMSQDLVPILSWAWYKGRCRRCRVPISVRYPLLEILFGILTAGLFMLLGIGLLSFLIPVIFLFLGVFVWSGFRYGVWPYSFLLNSLFLVVLIIFLEDFYGFLMPFTSF